MNRKQQGSIGVAKAINYYTSKGFAVFIPVSDISRYDLLIEKEGLIQRIEVKTSAQKNGEFTLRTLGGNRSWNGVVKRLSVNDCDKVYLANLLTGSEKEYDISELAGRSSIAFR